jgi:tetratricopeptide (TPR) repeat protein
MDNLRMRSEKIEKFQPKMLVAVGLAAAVLLVYGQTGRFDFIHSYDDSEYVVENPHIRQGITLRGIGWAFTTFYAANWHPAAWLSHMLDVDLFGLDAGRHHLTSVFLHLVNTLLLFYLLQRMTAATWRSAAVAALFALHPLHVESVAMVAERKDVLSTFFALLALHSYTVYAFGGPRRWYGLALVCFCLGLLAKPMVVSLPFVFLLLDFWPLQRWRPTAKAAVPATTRRADLSSLVVEKIPFFLLAAASGVVTVLAQHGQGATDSMAIYPFFHRLANASVSVVAYLVKTVWPYPLIVFYPYRATIPAWQWLGSAGLLAAATVAATYYSRNRQYLISGWLWYLGTLVPVIGIVQVGAQAMADRYTYIPLVGIFIMAVWGLHEATLRLRVPKAAVASGAAAILLMLGILSWNQTGYWSDSVRLFEHAAKNSTGNWVAHNNLGSALARRGQTESARVHYQTALEIAPAYADARYNLAVTLSGLGQNGEAIRQYRQVVAMAPDHAGALNNLCGELVAAGKIQTGTTYCRKAIAINPEFAHPHSNLAVAMNAAGRTPEAIDHYRQALKLDPENPDAHLALGKLLAENERASEALKHFHNALRLAPDNEPYCRQAADTLMRSGQDDAAAEFYAAALRLKPGSAETYNSLGVAFARLGRHDDAVVMFQQALQKNPGHRAAAGNLVKALKRR